MQQLARIWKHELTGRVAGRLAGIVILTAAGNLGAQAFNYPAMQTPTASVRDYTAGLAGGAGTTLFFQWREEAARATHWQLEAGLSDPKGPTNPLLFVGAGLGRELVRSTSDQPLDILLTAGAGLAVGDGSWFRIPIGTSIGHTFALDNSGSITPFVHPRVSLDYCSQCRGRAQGVPGAGRRGRSAASLNFDLGAHWQVNPEFGVRAAMAFSGSDIIGSDEVLAVGITWTPASLKR